jgi:D-alanine transaminase
VIVFFNGDFLPKEEVAISPDDRGFLFADGVYEVVRGYQGHLFRLREHLDRLRTSLRALQIHGLDVHQFSAIAERLLSENSLQAESATVYLHVTRGVARRSHCFPAPGTPPTVYASADVFRPQSHSDGAAAILVPDQRWARCDVKTISLLPNSMARQLAFEEGALEALFVRDGVILEGSHTNVFFVQEGQLTTAPLSDYLLAGITRQVVLELADTAGIPCHQRPVFESELRDVQEAFLAGTTVEIAPLVTIGGRPVGDGKVGRVTRQFQELFRNTTERERSAAKPFPLEPSEQSA